MGRARPQGHRAGHDYLVIRCQLPAALEDELPELLAGMAILGCHLQPVTAEQVTAEVYVDGDQEQLAAQVTDRLEQLGGSRVTCDGLATQDWLASYRSSISAFAIGRRWWMDPHPDTPTPAPPGRTRLVIEPRTAFGTGSHESTSLVLLELEERDLAGKRVLDVGTGSAVLALAAETLGATSVLAFDIDLAAVLVARVNCTLQEWPARTRLLAGPIDCLAGPPFDLVLCNMIPAQVSPLLAAISRLLATDGELICSGMLDSQEQAVTGELRAAGLQVHGRRIRNEWIALRGGHG